MNTKTLTTKSLVQHSAISPKLIRAVVKQLGDIETLRDVAAHGADAGYTGFTYYSDTVEFFRANRSEICQLVKAMARELGEEPLTMVAGFGCLSPADDDTKESIARCIYKGKMTDEDTQVANALAWFALEEVARIVEQVEEVA